MLNTQEAYEVLKLKPGANRNEISRRFTILLKKFNSASSADSVPAGSSGPSDGAPVVIDGQTLEIVTEAYNLLMGYETSVPGVAQGQEKSQKINNFIYYYKYHILIGIIVLLILVFTIRGCVMRVPTDINMAFIGDYSFSDTSMFEKEIISRNTGIKAIGTDTISISGKPTSAQDYDLRMKIVAIFAAGDVDLFIVDQAWLDEYGPLGGLSPLEDLLNQAGIPLDDKRVIYVTPKISDPKDSSKTIDGEKRIYGFDVSDSPVFKNAGLTGNQFIFTVYNKIKHPDKVLEMLRTLAGK